LFADVVMLRETSLEKEKDKAWCAMMVSWVEEQNEGSSTGKKKKRGVLLEIEEEEIMCDDVGSDNEGDKKIAQRKAAPTSLYPELDDSDDDDDVNDKKARMWYDEN
jgi:hypothetical protein